MFHVIVKFLSPFCLTLRPEILVGKYMIYADIPILSPKIECQQLKSDFDQIWSSGTGAGIGAYCEYRERARLIRFLLNITLLYSEYDIVCRI